MVNFFIERGRRHRSSKFFFLYHQSLRIVSKMGKCWKHCQFPLLPVEASQHCCFNCSKKFHALCSSVRHPRADELGLGLGSDILCPTCAGYTFLDFSNSENNITPLKLWPNDNIGDITFTIAETKFTILQQLIPRKPVMCVIQAPWKTVSVPRMSQR